MGTQLHGPHATRKQNDLACQHHQLSSTNQQQEPLKDLGMGPEPSAAKKRAIQWNLNSMDIYSIFPHHKFFFEG